MNRISRMIFYNRFFTKFSSTIEKILVSNNYRKLLTECGEQTENQNFVKTLEFKFPEKLFSYLNISGTDQYILNYNEFVFFDLNPSIFAISYSISFNNNNNNIFSNDIINLILIVNMNTGNVDKIFYSFCKICCLSVVGEYEDLIIGGREDGIIDLFHMKPIHEKFYLNYENLNKNIIFYEDHNNDIKPQFYLKLPIFSTSNVHSGKVVKINTSKRDNNSYRLVSLDVDGNIIIWELKGINDINNDTFPIRKIKEIVLQIIIGGEQKLKCYNSMYRTDSKDSIYLLANVGLIKLNLDLDLSDQHIHSFIHNNEKECVSITAFSISDNGYLLCSYNDSCIRYYIY